MELNAARLAESSRHPSRTHSEQTLDTTINDNYDNGGRASKTPPTLPTATNTTTSSIQSSSGCGGFAGGGGGGGATVDTSVDDDPDYRTNTTGTSPAPRIRNAANNRHAVRTSNAYVRNYRLSRYRNAWMGALPFRLNPITDDTELPLDSVGFHTTCTFAWVRRYRVSQPVHPTAQPFRWRWPFRDGRCRWWWWSRTPPTSSAAAANNNSSDGVGSSSIAASSNGTAASTSSQQRPMPALTVGPTTSSSTATVGQPDTGGGGGYCLPPLVPQLPAADRCEVNAKRLLGLYKYEEQSRGRIGASMLRVAWLFCRTRILVACALHTLANLMGVLMLAVFLQLTMRMIDDTWQTVGVPRELDNRAVVVATVRRSTEEQQWKMVALLIGLVASLLAQSYARSAAHALGLRTAVRLRTACIGAICSKSLKASVRHRIAAHQIASLAADECQQLAEAIIKGPFLLAHLLGLGFCATAAAISLGAPGIWPLFGVVGILPVGLVCALLSGIFYRRSLSFLGKKLSIVEEYHNSFDADGYLAMHDTYTKRFAGALSAQYTNLCRSQLFQSATVARLCSLVVILGGTYLVWCDIQFTTEATAMTVLTVMYVLLVPGWVGEWLEAVQALVHGRAVLGKVKQALTLSPPELPKMRPQRELKASMTDAIFRWNMDGGDTLAATDAAASAAQAQTPFELRIDSFAIPRGALVGITGTTGSGKTAMVHALLGHLQLVAGEFYQREKGSLYPEVPYRVAGASIRANIVFHDDWNESRYRSALQLVELHYNEGADERTAADQVQDLLQLQRIGMARALYSDRDWVVLEEPLSAVDVESDLDELFAACAARLREQGKTVVVVSQNESILKHCQRLYVLQHGVSTGFVDYEDVTGQPAYRQCVADYAERKRAARHDVHLSYLANPNSALNISTEDLVADDPEAGQQSCEPTKGVLKLQNFMLGGMLSLDAIFAAICPLLVVVYLTNEADPQPWAVLNIVVFVPLMLFTSWLTKTCLNRWSRQHNKRLQRELFAQLLRTGLADQREVHLGQLQHAMIDNNLELWYQRATVSFCMWMVTLCVFMCFFFKSIMFLAVLLPLIDCCVRCGRYSLTVDRYAGLEAESRLKLMHLLGNLLRGRVVVQSFDAVQRMRASLYRTVEENSAAELVMRAAMAYSQHAFVFWQATTLALSLVVLNAYPHRFATEYGIEVYVYLQAVAHLGVLLNARLQQMASERQLYGVQRLLRSGSLNTAMSDLSTLKYDC